MTFDQILAKIDDFVWGVPLIVLILAAGLLLTIRTGFIQVRHLPRALRYLFKEEVNEEEEIVHGEVSGFASLCTALSATIGTGNIVGVATAVGILAGGPGALFWMWMAAFLGMATKYSEGFLAVKYRTVDEDGHVLGGPFYYIEKGMGVKWKWLAKIFAFFGACVGLMGIGTFSQVNGIASAVTGFFDPNMTNTITLFGNDYSIVTVISAFVLAILAGLVIIGGLKRISSVSQVVVPFMAILYVLTVVVLIICNITKLPAAIAEVVTSAFGAKAMAGGALGAVLISMKNGIARGIFSNEAGLGTGSIAHACSDVKHPVQQGLWGIFEVFIDTIVICTLTALVILCSGTDIAYGQAAGADLTINGFVATYGNWISIFTAVALCCFAFSTILGWGLYGSRCVGFLFGSKLIKPFMVVYAFVAIIGATMDLGLLWDIADTFNGLMIIPNLIAVFMLSGTVVKLTREYFQDGPGKFGVETGKEN